MDKSKKIQIITAPWIIPVNASDTVNSPTILKHHAVIIEQDIIKAIVPTNQAEQQYSFAETINLGQHILLPGLINSHTHSAMSLMRGIADDLPLMEWLQNHIWPIEQQYLCDDFVSTGSLLACAEMLKTGTTCFSDMYFFPEATAKAAVQAGMRAQISGPILKFPSIWAKTDSEYFNQCQQFVADWQRHHLITPAYGPHAPYTVTDAMFQKLMAITQSDQLKIHLHLHETEHEVKEAKQLTGLSPIQRLEQLGLLTPQLQAVHMTVLTAAEIDLIANRQVSVVHCPESNLKLASGFCPVQALINAGVNVSLGTDGAASNNDLDLFGEMKTAALISKGISQDASALSAYQSLRMATINGAKTLGLEDQIGSLEVGKQADLIAIDISAINTQPLYNPISHLVYAASGHQVTHTWVGGTLAYQQGQYPGIELKPLHQKISLWAEKLHQKNS